MVELEVTGLRQVLGWMEALPPAVREEILTTFEEAGETLRARAEALAPVGATGNLKRSITVRRLRGLAIRVGPTAPHRHLVIRGRRPGKMPPPDAIADWAELRGLKGKEFVVARAIGARGTRGQPFMAHALAGAGAEVRARVADAVRRVIAGLAGRR